MIQAECSAGAERIIGRADALPALHGALRASLGRPTSTLRSGGMEDVEEQCTIPALIDAFVAGTELGPLNRHFGYGCEAG